MAFRIECIDLVKRYGDSPVLDGLNWTVEAGELVGLVGPSGAGKTTLLRIIAGLEDCTSGQVRLTTPEGVPHGAGPAIGMVFQNLALWPHLTAWRHVECVLGKIPRRERKERVEAAMSEAQVPPSVWHRRPSELSGGEAQRLALARALAPKPGILLLDEPLAQVDTVLRGELLALVGQVARSRGVTTVYVTHHWDEAIALGRHAAVLVHGRITASGTVDGLFWAPGSAEVARLTGPVVEIPGDWVADGLITGRTAQVAAIAKDQGGERLLARPQQIRLLAPQGANCWHVAECEAEGPFWRVLLVQGPRSVRVSASLPLEMDQRVGIEVQPPAGFLKSEGGCVKKDSPERISPS